MDIKYNIIQYLEKKDSRFVAVIQYKGGKAVLKKITTKNKRLETLDNSPDNFMKIINGVLIEQIIRKLIDLNLTKIPTPNTPKRPLVGLCVIILTQLKKGEFRPYYFKLILLLFYYYLKNKSLFMQNAATKGDMTECNLLICENEVKFIDFDSYSSNGFWLEDASYLLLHQDVIIEKLSWQKVFYKKYISAIKKIKVNINKEYIRFWLLYTS
ncbi:MAG: hypothetical protein CSA18_05090, partial [Deltaproteobacteria bacterium]